MKDALCFVAGFVLLGVYFWMLTDHVSSRIRNSKFWFVGWFGGLMILSMGAKLMLPVLNKLPLDDDVLVPCLLFGMMLVVGLVAIFQMWRLRRAIKQG